MTISDDPNIERSEVDNQTSLAVTPEPTGDLARWRDKMRELLGESVDRPAFFNHLAVLERILAAMPAQDVNAELLDNLNTCAGLLGDDYDLLDSKDDSHMAIRVVRVKEALVDARAAIVQAEQGAAG